MEKTKVPAQIYEFLCPNCGYRVEYPLFLASFYDYDTFLELKTKTIVRIDLTCVYYKYLDKLELLKEFSKNNFDYSAQHEWINLLETKICNHCNKRFSNEDNILSRQCIEELIEVVILP